MSSLEFMPRHFYEITFNKEWQFEAGVFSTSGTNKMYKLYKSQESLYCPMLKKSYKSFQAIAFLYLWIKQGTIKNPNQPFLKCSKASALYYTTAAKLQNYKNIVLFGMVLFGMLYISWFILYIISAFGYMPHTSNKYEFSTRAQCENGALKIFAVEYPIQL